MNDIAKRKNYLPDTIEDLRKFILIAPEKLKSVRAEINAIKKAGLAKEVRDQKINEGQFIGEAILWAEAKLGGMLKDIPLSKKRSSSSKGTCSLPKGIDKKTSHKAQLLADNQDVIKEVVSQAKKNEDIPTKTAVLKIIQEKTKSETHIKRHKKMALPKGEYNIVYADPPWQYEHAVSNSRKIENQYPTMKLEDICKLNINPMMAEDVVLFMWATNPKLEEALTVLNYWQFKYRTNVVWVKDKIGMGYYFRQQHELLLIATRGNPTTPLPKNRVSSVLNAPRMEHSSKPDIMYEIIEKLYPNANYLELFARNKRKNWTSWGNE